MKEDHEKFSPGRRERIKAMTNTGEQAFVVDHETTRITPVLVER